MSFQRKLRILLSDDHVYLSHGKTCQFVDFIMHFSTFREKQGYTTNMSESQSINY